jgi:Protein of unknown function (DUF3616)
MMHSSVLAWIVVAAFAHGAGAAEDKVMTGEIQIPEISGVAFLPGDRLLVVADDPHPESDPVVFLLENASQRLASGKALKKEEFKGVALSDEVKDLEDVAWDQKSDLFLITSHSLNKDGEVKPKRSVISRLALEGFNQERLPALQIPAEFEEARKLTPAKAGFNVEGAAWRDGHLLLGLRAPTDAKTKDAILLEIEKPGSKPLDAKVAARLNLKGNGIRGLFYDPKAHGLWILAGVSPDLPDGTVKEWALWFRQDDGKLKPITPLPKESSTLINAEAVTRVSVGAKDYLLVVEDGAEASHYLLFPVPEP